MLAITNGINLLTGTLNRQTVVITDRVPGAKPYDTKQTVASALLFFCFVYGLAPVTISENESCTVYQKLNH